MAKRKVIQKRKERNQKKGISTGNSKYAKKKQLQRKGVYSPRSPFYNSDKEESE